MDQANRRAMVGAISEALGLSHTEANLRLLESLDQAQDGGSRPSLYGTTLALGVPDELIEKWQLHEMKPEQCLKRDATLRDSICKLRQYARTALLTNSRRSITERILQSIGLDNDLFDAILAGEELQQAKPSPHDLERLIYLAGGEIADGIVIGDRWAVDLEPAQNLGMQILHVAGRDEVVKWLRQEVSRLETDQPE